MTAIHRSGPRGPARVDVVPQVNLRKHGPAPPELRDVERQQAAARTLRVGDDVHGSGAGDMPNGFLLLRDTVRRSPKETLVPPATSFEIRDCNTGKNACDVHHGASRVYKPG